MLNLPLLEQKRNEASVDKADLFDFYNDNWDKLIKALVDLQKNADLAEDLVDTFPGLKNSETEVNGGDLVYWLTLRLE